MRKSVFIVSVAAFLFACSDSGVSSKEETAKTGLATAPPKDTTKKSIPSEVSKTIGNTTLKIAYHSPAVRGRVIWGGLVPYDAVWVTGAHKATTLEVGQPFSVGDTNIPAGKYAIFSIPGKEEWTIIINKNWNQHLADDYAESEDVARLVVKPQNSPNLTERLQYEIEPAEGNAANIIISWEKLRVPFRIKVQ